MPQVQYSVNVQGGGVSISRSFLRTSDNANGYDPVIPAGKSGTLTTRSDANTGTLTLSGGHGIITGQIVDLYWAGGMRYGVEVGTVSGNSVPFDLGAGDDLPIATTAIVCSPRVQINATIDGDGLELISMDPGYTDSSSTAKAHAEFQDADDDTIAEIDLFANVTRTIDVDGGDTNPFTGDVINRVFVSNGSSSADMTFKMVVSQDSTS